MPTLAGFQLEAQFREYVWGGQRLRPGQKTAEVWAVYEGNRILGGPLDGRTLAEAAGEHGAALLGELVVQRFGTGPRGARFPLLIKLLDCADWLSLQVHPNDEQAGPDQYGKTEAWHILEADPGAEILCGFRPGVERSAALDSVRDGTILGLTQRVSMHTGETVFIPAGTLHALGPGLLVYEVQQSSDITYRVFDWNRPASAGRKLHIDESLAVLDTSATARPLPPQPFRDGERARLITCPYFSLDLLTVKKKILPLNTRGQTFHSLTVIEGAVEVQGNTWRLPLKKFESAVIPASAGEYRIVPMEQARVLAAGIE